MKNKYFRDPVHGYIEVSPCALKIIDSPFFQRLRNIKQLAFSNYVYHGAEHSRFGHSLGVYHLARKICDILLKEKSKEIKEEFCLSALLHDIGHHPYSHSFESIGKKYIRDPENTFDHEDYSIEIINHTEISDLIQIDGYDKEHVIQLLSGSYTEDKELQYLNHLISSEFDIDRLDYLLRDSYYCGVPYGQIDLERLFRYLEPNENKVIISEKGLQSAEMYVLARHYMYTQVYTHRTTRAFDLMLHKCIDEDIFNSFHYPSVKDNMYDFLEFDDIWLRNKLKEISNIRGYDNNIFAKKILKREPIKCVIEKNDLIERGTDQADANYVSISNLRHDLDRIAEYANTSVDSIFIDEPWRNLPIDSSYHPYFSYEEPGDEHGDKQPIRIKTREGVKDIAALSHSIAFRIARHQAKVIRIYCLNNNCNKIAQAISYYWPNLESLVWVRAE